MDLSIPPAAGRGAGPGTRGKGRGDAGGSRLTPPHSAGAAAILEPPGAAARPPRDAAARTGLPAARLSGARGGAEGAGGG